MPGQVCCIASCKNVYFKTRLSNGTRSWISYHHFPKDPKLRDIWIDICGRSEDFNSSTGRVCSEHFTDDSFEEDVEARIMGLVRPRKLKQGAIPTENIFKLNNSSKDEEIQNENKSEDIQNGSLKRSTNSRGDKIFSEEHIQILDSDPAAFPDFCKSCKNLIISLAISEKKRLTSKVAEIKSNLNDLLKQTNISDELNQDIGLKTIHLNTELIKTNDEISNIDNAIKPLFSEEEIKNAMKKKEKGCSDTEDVG